MAGIVAVTVLTSGLTLASPLILREVFDSAFATRNVRLLCTLCLMLVAAQVVQQALGICQGYLDMVVTNRIVVSIRMRAFNAVGRCTLLLGLSNTSGQIVQRLSLDADVVASAVVGFVPAILEMVLILLGCLACLSHINSWFILLAMVSILPGAWVNLKVSKLIHAVERKLRRQADMLADAEHETAANTIALPVFGMKGRQRRAYGRLLRDTFGLMRYKFIRVSFLNSLMWMLRSVPMLLIALVSGMMVLQGKETPGAVVAMCGYVVLLLKPFERASQWYRSIMRACVAAERLSQYQLNRPPTVASVHAGFSRIRRELAIRDLEFSYPGAAACLKGLNLTIRAGDVVNLVAPSGSGKTTLLFIVAKLYPNFQGRIVVDGVDLGAIPSAAYWRQLSIVPQEPQFFRASIYENCACGQAGIALSQVRQCAESIGLDEFIMGLPRQYDTMINEGRFSVSSGQAQKLAIIRALVKRPSLLLLDEATSALDHESEQRVLDAIASQRRADSIVIMASHRVWISGHPMVSRTFPLRVPSPSALVEESPVSVCMPWGRA